MKYSISSQTCAILSTDRPASPIIQYNIDFQDFQDISAYQLLGDSGHVYTTGIYTFMIVWLSGMLSGRFLTYPICEIWIFDMDFGIFMDFLRWSDFHESVTTFNRDS